MPKLNGKQVDFINSYLKPYPEQEASKLKENEGFSFQGSVVAGTGFTLTPDGRQELIQKNTWNNELIMPYIGGSEVNSSPTQSFERYVINFGSRSLEEAEKWPDLIDIVREKVKPERDKVRRDAHKKYWWQYGDKRPALCKALEPLERCLVCAVTTKHLSFSFLPANWVLNNRLIVFPTDSFSFFSTLQSRVQEVWARLLSSTLGGTLNYAPSDCFETFPFPNENPGTEISELETIGQELYNYRAQYMVDTNQGLTKTYNALKDSSNNEYEIVQLRKLHQQLDIAVLKAYGWGDIEVPEYPNTTESFKSEIIKRLYKLNRERKCKNGWDCRNKYNCETSPMTTQH